MTKTELMRLNKGDKVKHHLDKKFSQTVRVKEVLERGDDYAFIRYSNGYLNVYPNEMFELVEG